MNAEHTYENTRRIQYGDEGATFVPVCEKCGRYVKADKTVFFSEIDGLSKRPNATCAKCGRTWMVFEGFL